jgi:hypothetical protein
MVIGQQSLSIEYVSDEGMDVDGNGLFDFISIEVEVNIPQSGIYIIETSDIKSQNGENIPVKVYKRLSLIEGEHRVTITFDGRRIRSTGKSPEYFDFINIISSDYSDADLLNDVELKNDYSYNDFEEPPIYTVGVRKDDVILYNVTEIYVPSSVSPSRSLESLFLTIEGVNDSIVYLDLGFQYSDNSTEGEKLDGYLEKGSLIFPFLIPAEMDAGESFGQREPVKLNDASVESLFGHNRTIYHYEEEQTFDTTDVEHVLSQEYYWDQETGVMVRAWVNTTSKEKSTGELIENNVLMEIFGTTLIQETTELNIELDSEQRQLEVELVDSEGEPVPNAEVVIKKGDLEIGRYRTDNSGFVEINIEQEDGVIVVEYPGSLVYEPAEKEVTIPRSSKNNNLLTIFGITIFILIIGVVLVLRRFYK